MEVSIRFLTPTFLYGADQRKAEFRIKSLIGQMRYWWRMTKKWPETGDKAHRLFEKESKLFGFRDKGAKPFYLYMKKNEIVLEKSREKSDKKSRAFLYDKMKNEEMRNLMNRYKDKLFIQQVKGRDGKHRNRLEWKGFMSDEEYENLKKMRESDGCWQKAINSLYQKAHRFIYSETIDGISYLFFPFNQARRERFTWIAPDSEVRLELEFTRNTDTAIREQVLLSLFLLSRFGGLGSRSRRGAGALEIKVNGERLFDYTEEDVAKFVINCRTGPECFQYIENDSPIACALKNPSRYLSNMRVFREWKETLDYLGNSLRNFRTQFDLRNKGVISPTVHPDFVKDAIHLHKYYETENDNDAPKELSKTAFGLPIVVNFSEKKGRTRRFVSGGITIAPFKGCNAGRRASPLHITVNRRKCNAGTYRYYLTAIVLWDGIGYLPEDRKIKLLHKNKEEPLKANKIGIDELPEVQSPSPEKLEHFLRILC